MSGARANPTLTPESSDLVGKRINIIEAFPITERWGLLPLGWWSPGDSCPNAHGYLREPDKMTGSRRESGIDFPTLQL